MDNKAFLINQKKIYADLQAQSTAKYTCVICGNNELTKSTWQNVAGYKTNRGKYMCESDVEKSMCVCCEECRREYVKQGLVPRHLLMRETGIPRRFSAATMELWNDPSKPGKIHLYNRVKEWVSGDLSRGWFFTGNTGTGKTTLAAAIAYELRKHERTVLFTDANYMACEAVIQSIKARNMSDFIDKYLSYDVLIIDDVDNHHLNDNAKLFMYQVFADAYNEKKALILTSNLTAQQIAINMGAERLESRIVEMCEQVLLEGKDKRKNGEGKNSSQ